MTPPSSPSRSPLLSSPLLGSDLDYNGLDSCHRLENPAVIDLSDSPTSHLDDDDLHLHSYPTLFPSPLPSLSHALPGRSHATFLPVDNATIPCIPPPPPSLGSTTSSFLSDYDSDEDPALEFDNSAFVWRPRSVEVVRPPRTVMGLPKRRRRPGPADCHSPRWTRRGVEGEEEALCEVCEPRTKELEKSEWWTGEWIKSDRYEQHMAAQHGISPDHHLVFLPPLVTRDSLRDNPAEYRKDGLCFCCGTWVDSAAVSGLAPSPPGVNFSAWFHHSRLCHPDSRSLLQPGLPFVHIVNPTAPIALAPKPRLSVRFDPALTAPPPERKAARRRPRQEAESYSDDKSGDDDYRPSAGEGRSQPKVKRVRGRASGPPSKRIRTR